MRDGTPRTRAELVKLTGLARSTVGARVDALLAAGLLSASGEAALDRGPPAGPVRVQPGRPGRARQPTSAPPTPSSPSPTCGDASWPRRRRHRHRRRARSGARPRGEDRTPAAQGRRPRPGRPRRRRRGAARARRALDRPAGAAADHARLGRLRRGGPRRPARSAGPCSSTTTSTSWRSASTRRSARTSSTCSSSRSRPASVPASSAAAGCTAGRRAPRATSATWRPSTAATPVHAAATPAASRRSRAVRPSRGRCASAASRRRQPWRRPARGAGRPRCAAQAVRQAGREIGDVLATCVSLLNPSVIVVGGLAGRGRRKGLLAGIREVVYGRSLPLATGTCGSSLAHRGPRRRHRRGDDGRAARAVRRAGRAAGRGGGRGLSRDPARIVGDAVRAAPCAPGPPRPRAWTRRTPRRDAVRAPARAPGTPIPRVPVRRSRGGRHPPRPGEQRCAPQVRGASGRLAVAVDLNPRRA